VIIVLECMLIVLECVNFVSVLIVLECVNCVRVQLKSDGTRRRTGGELKGKLANGVGSH
jgi:hypothetical protein